MQAPGQQRHRLLHVFPSFEVGGAQRRFAQIVNRLDRDIEHSVFAMDGCYDSMSLISDGVPVTNVDCEIPTNLARRIRSFKNRLQSLNPSKLVTYNWGSIEWAMACRLTRLPHIHIEDGFGREEAEQRFARRTWTRRAVLRRRSDVVLPSKVLLKIAQEEWCIPSERLHYIPNGVDTERFTPRKADHALKTDSIPEGKILIGTVAALRREKNLFRLLQGFQVMPSRTKCHLVVAGDGDLRAQLEQSASDLGISDQVSFLGSVANPEELLPELDLFVLSSDTEQMPLSILEAMAAGLAIASVDVGDVKAMISDSNRPYIAARDHESLADAMERLVVSPAARGDLGASNRDKAERVFSMDKMISEYRELFLR